MTRAFVVANSAAIIVAMLLAGCATPSATTQSAHEQPGAFSATPLDSGRYQIRVIGHPHETAQTVQVELLRRAAELALREGYDGFEAADQEARVQSLWIASPSPLMQSGFTGGVNQGFLPRSWRDTGPRWGGDWRNWDPFWGEPTFENQRRVRRADLVVASAQITLRRGEGVTSAANVYDARALLSRKP